MAGTKISEATLRSTLKGTEQIPLVDTDLPKGKTTAANLKTYCTPDLSGYAKKSGDEFTGAVGTTQLSITKGSQGSMAAILASANDIQFRTMNAGVTSMTFNVQNATPLKITESGIQENGTALEQKYAKKSELNAKISGTGVTSVQVVTELPSSPSDSTLYIVVSADEEETTL